MFGVDVKVPGMLHASIVQCPVFGGKVKSVDSAAAEKMRGVKKIVREADFVAVVADNWWRANQAVKALKVEWDFGANGAVSDASIEKLFREGLAATNLPDARKIGDTTAAFATAAKVIEAEYSSPYLNHATMEPQTCTAWFKPDGTLEVWTSTQNAEASMAAASEVAGIPQEKIEVHKPMLGGGFGRRGAPQDFVRQGVAIAKQMPGTPVKMMWNREEDMQHGYYRPASLVQMKAGLDKDGNVVAMHTKIACPSILALLRPEGIQKGIDFSAVRTFNDMTYTIPNQQVDYAMRNPHVPVGFWRAPGLQNAHYRECFIDELAHAAGKEPLAFRLAMMKPDDKNRRVLEAAAKAANWGSPLPAGVFRGIAQADGFRQLQRHGGRGVGECCRRTENPPHRVRHRFRPCGQPGHLRRAGREQRDLWHRRAALSGQYGEGRPHPGIQLPRLPVAQADRHAESGDCAGAVRRLLGRPRRAGHPGADAGHLQRHLRRHRQANSHAAVEGGGFEGGMRSNQDA